MTIAQHATRVCFLILCSSIASSAQTDSLSSTEFFPKVLDSLFISKNGFYLQKVTDVRTNKTNNGYVERDLSKRRLLFNDSLSAYVSSFIYPGKQHPSLVPLSIQVEKFRLFASSDGKTDNAQIYVKLHYYDEIAQEKLRTFERTLNFRKKTDPNFIGKVVYDAFRISLSSLRPKTVLRVAPVPAAVNTENKDINDTVKTEVIYIPQVPETKNRNVHTIPLASTPFIWSSEEFYLADVKDVRGDQQNVGMVQKGFFSLKAEAELDSGLENYLKKSIASTPSPSKRALTMFVRSFQIKEEQTAYGEENNLMLVAILAYDSSGSTVQVYKNVIELDTTSDKDLTPEWPVMIKKALAVYFQPFEANKTHLALEENVGQNSYYNTNEIREEKFGFGDRYFYRGKELKGINDFSNIFKTDADSINNTFATAKSLRYMGRISMGIGGALLAWAGVDFLLSEEKSLTKWYNGGDETSTIIKFWNQKTVVNLGTAHLIGGLISNIVSKVVLDKAVRMHNKSLAERVSFRAAPDIYNKGFQFHLHMFLSCQ